MEKPWVGGLAGTLGADGEHQGTPMKHPIVKGMLDRRRWWRVSQTVEVASCWLRLPIVGDDGRVGYGILHLGHRNSAQDHRGGCRMEGWKPQGGFPGFEVGRGCRLCFHDRARKICKPEIEEGLVDGSQWSQAVAGGDRRVWQHSDLKSAGIADYAFTIMLTMKACSGWLRAGTVTVGRGCAIWWQRRLLTRLDGECLDPGEDEKQPRRIRKRERKETKRRRKRDLERGEENSEGGGEELSRGKETRVFIHHSSSIIIR